MSEGLPHSYFFGFLQLRTMSVKGFILIAAVLGVGAVLFALFALGRPEASPKKPRSIPIPADSLYLPDGRIVFSNSISISISIARIDGKQHRYPRAPRSLFTSNLDGSQMERITFFNSVDRPLSILNDGRILFKRKLFDNGEEKEEMLMTVNPDGTGVQRFYESPKTMTMRSVKSVKSKPKILTSVVNKQKRTGWLLCLNVYLSQISAVTSSKPNPMNQQNQRNPKGEKKVQVLEAQSGQLLGEAPIEVDGSFYLEVPADTLLKLRVVDESEESDKLTVLASLESGIWVRPNETRGCIGCHEDPYLAPENAVPMAVQKPSVVLGR